MISFNSRGILLDIEGTTSSIRFVYDEMFPFARRELADYLNKYWKSSELAETCEVMARDAGYATCVDWWNGAEDESSQRLIVRDEAIRLMDGDVKATGLKQLQGLIWRVGFESGEMHAHLFDDVLPALEHWSSIQLDLRVFSSGSVQAQKLFFGHTIYGNVLHFFRGHYDTTIGSKREPDSYSAIAAEFELPGTDILFLSDVVAELDAAREAGMQTALCVRPGNTEIPEGTNHPRFTSFREIELQSSWS